MTPNDKCMIAIQQGPDQPLWYGSFSEKREPRSILAAYPVWCWSTRPTDATIHPSVATARALVADHPTPRIGKPIAPWAPNIFILIALSQSHDLADIARPIAVTCSGEKAEEDFMVILRPSETFTHHIVDRTDTGISTRTETMHYDAEAGIIRLTWSEDTNEPGSRRHRHGSNVWDGQRNTQYGFPAWTHETCIYLD